MGYNSIWKKIGKTSLLYLAGQVVARLVSFCMLPLYTSSISTEAYGIYDAVAAYAAIIVPLVGVNCWQGMLRFIIDKKNYIEKEQIVSSGWLMLGISLIILTCGFWLLCYFISFSNRLLIYLYLITQMLQYFYLYTARGFEKNSVYAISGIISAIAVAAVSLLCVFVLHLQIETLYLSQIVSFIVQVFYIETRLNLLCKIKLRRISKPQLREIYKYCFPESIGTIFNWLLSSANRLIIVAVLGYSANGIYAISNKFLNILNILLTAFVLSFQEGIYSADPSDIERTANDVIEKFSKFIGVTVGLVLIGTSVIYPLFVSGEYTEGYRIIPLFYIYFLVSGITWLLSSIVSATKKTYITLIEKMIIGVLNFALISSTIRMFNIASSPISLFCSELLGIFVFKLLLKSKANYRIRIPLKWIVLDIIFIAAASVIFYINRFWLSIAVLLIVCALLGLKFRTEIYMLKEKFTDKLTP